MSAPSPRNGYDRDPRKPGDLWGVSHGPKVRTRGPEARARRAAKRAARKAGLPLKQYLRGLR